MWTYNHTQSNELYHYGVLGMKWGRRKAKKLSNKVKTDKKSAKEWEQMADYAKRKGKTKRAAKFKKYAKQDIQDAKKHAEAASRSLDKVKAQQIKNKYAKEYVKGKSAVGKAISKLLGTDRNYAELMYDMDKRGKVNKAWRD